MAELLEEDKVISEINITPLTDVFLVLLIVFMIATPFLMYQGIKVSLPSTIMGTPNPEAIVVTIDKEKNVSINDNLVKEALLLEYLRKSLMEKEDKLVIIRGDKTISLGDAVAIMDIAKRAGAERIAIATEKEIEKDRKRKVR
ncbi:TPA: protein TolR [bacterium]|nr:protein TolR [bacterium]